MTDESSCNIKAPDPGTKTTTVPIKNLLLDEGTKSKIFKSEGKIKTQNSSQTASETSTMQHDSTHVSNPLAQVLVQATKLAAQGKGKKAAKKAVAAVESSKIFLHCH